MTSTPPAAKVNYDDDNDVMEIDSPANGHNRAEPKSNPEPSKDQTRPASNKQSPVEILDDEDEEEEEGDEEAYAVEKVLAHKIGKKANGQRGFIYKIKWLGFDDPADDTWEDEENCEGSEQLVHAYWESVPGGKPSLEAKSASARKRHLSTPASDTGSRKRRQTGVSDDSPTKPEQETWKPPTDLASWEDFVSEVETVEKTSSGLLLVYLLWNNGNRYCTDTTVVYQKCPQKMLKFYESHLVFRVDDSEVEEKQENHAAS